MTRTIKRYSDLTGLSTYRERLEFLQLYDAVGMHNDTVNRRINQAFYRSSEWKATRNFVVCRDNACDMGLDDYAIYSGGYVHHIVPITTEMLANADSLVFDPENLITVTQATHNAIHYGIRNDLSSMTTERCSGDTKLW